MENLIPLNGRIAIVDDQIEQALPLMRVFAKNNIPYVYYKGDDADYFPEQPENDIRILILDLNLIGGRDNQPKDIRSSLYSVIKRIISPSNYPYVLVLWSRQEKEYKEMLEELFKKDLNGCAPIVILEWIKSYFFPDFSDEEVNKDEEYKIIDELKKVVAGFPAYSHLMQWENNVHHSADATIQDIFHDYHSHDEWEDNARCILDLFAKSYLEKHYRDVSTEDKAKASLFFLNDVYYDTLESTITNSRIENAVELNYKTDTDMESDIKSKINNYLLLSKSQTQINHPGCIFTGTDNSVECVRCSKAILNDSLMTEDVRNQVIERFHDMRSQEAKELYNNIMKDRRDAILFTAVPCGVVVTAACDYAQNKAKYDRIVMGLIIDSCYKDLIDTKSEAIYVSPVFDECSHERVLILNYRYFYTQNLNKIEGVKSLFRIRNSVLSEIQSKLARHINRQGVMTL